MGLKTQDSRPERLIIYSTCTVRIVPYDTSSYSTVGTYLYFRLSTANCTVTISVRTGTVCPSVGFAGTSCASTVQYRYRVRFSFVRCTTGTCTYLVGTYVSEPYCTVGTDWYVPVQVKLKVPKGPYQVWYPYRTGTVLFYGTNCMVLRRNTVLWYVWYLRYVRYRTARIKSW